jgi:hypothetical protein
LYLKYFKLMHVKLNFNSLLNFLMNFNIRLFLLLSVSALFAACSKWEEPPVISRLQIVNAFPDAASLSVRVNNSIDTSLNFGSYTYYQQLRAGRSILQVGAGEDVTASGDLFLAENRTYSLYLLKGRTGADSVFIRRDTLPAPEVGRAKIRFANLSPVAGGIGLIGIGPNNDTLRLPVRTFPNFTPFTTVDAAQGYRFILLSGNAAVASISDQLLSSERAYTFVAAGYAGLPPGNPQALTLRVVENRE